MTPKSKDTIYSDPQEQFRPFQFDQRVAHAFNDMISRSVPYYQDLQTLVLRLLEPYLQADHTILDCGCATGTSIHSISTAFPKLPLTFYGIDNSNSMLDSAKQTCRHLPNHQSVHFECVSLETWTSIPDHNITLLILTLQFLDPKNRLSFLQRLSEKAESGSIIILIEKIAIPNPNLSRHYTDLHHGFKKDQGYSDLEIAQKRDAIETVLIPLSLEENLTLLHQAGYTKTDVFFKWLNFAGILAIKD